MSDLVNPKEQYSYYYNRLYPLLKEGRIDFALVAHRTGFKERKVRETILFRLTAGEVKQLFGKRDGCCYLCDLTFQMSAKEPLCLSCLQSIDTAVQELQLEQLSEQHPHPPEDGEGAPDAAEIVSDRPEAAASPGGQDLPDMIPRAQYEALWHELQNYRRMAGQPVQDFQAFAASVQYGAVHPVSDMAVGIPGAGNADGVLGILNMAEGEVAYDDVEIPASPTQLQVPLRHFGFQRLKSRA